MISLARNTTVQRYYDLPSIYSSVNITGFHQCDITAMYHSTLTGTILVIGLANYVCF